MSEVQPHQAHSPNSANKKFFLLIDNPSKSNHLGTLLRCAAAFQCHQVLLVGYDKFNCQGSFGSHLFLDIVAFHCWDAVMDYLRSGACLDKRKEEGDDSKIGMDESECKRDVPQSKQGVSIIGILGACGGGEEVFWQEGVKVYGQPTGYVSLKPTVNDTVESQQPTVSCLSNKSYPIHTRPFSKHVCFIVSKDKHGLPISQARLCDGFVHVPHLDIFGINPSKEPTAIKDISTKEIDTSSQSTLQQSVPQSLLDTATTLSITLHHYTAWAGYTERQFEDNQKFVQDTRPTRVRYLGVGKSYRTRDGAVDKEADGLDANMAIWKSEGSSDY